MQNYFGFWLQIKIENLTIIVWKKDFFFLPQFFFTFESWTEIGPLVFSSEIEFEKIEWMYFYLYYIFHFPNLNSSNEVSTTSVVHIQWAWNVVQSTRFKQLPFPSDSVYVFLLFLSFLALDPGRANFLSRKVFWTNA